MIYSSFFIFLSFWAWPSAAQLTGSVGPTTSTYSKAAVICNVLDYGGTVGSIDIGPAVTNAFENCVLKNAAATLYVPPGKYGIATFPRLKHGSHWAFQMDGIITRTASGGNEMIAILNAHDFEFFSSTSAGAIQGNGYQLNHSSGPLLVLILSSTDWSIHDLILVDSPKFHLFAHQCSNGEIYNMAIRGANLGGSDGIDISGDNNWVHDVEVTNRDECVTVKSPASNILVERIWCNQSGGSAIGSLGSGTAISNIVYRNIYTNGGNQAFMLKSRGGDGYVTNVTLQNFIFHETAYGLDINQYWSYRTNDPGNGVLLTNITIEDWYGSIVSGKRATAQFLCADGAPCSSINVINVNIRRSDTKQATHKCQSAYGSGSCLKAGSGTSYQTTTIIAQPSAYTGTPPTLHGDLSAGFDKHAVIPVPTIPSTYYPGLPQISSLAKNLRSNGSSSK